MKLPQAARRCWGLGGGGCKPSVGVREPSSFLTKNSSNERRKRVERCTIADHKWVSRFIG